MKVYGQCSVHYLLLNMLDIKELDELFSHHQYVDKLWFNVLMKHAIQFYNDEDYNNIMDVTPWFKDPQRCYIKIFMEFIEK